MKNANLYRKAVAAPGGVDSDFLDLARAAHIMRKRGPTSFIPTAYPGINSLVSAAGVLITTDVPTRTTSSPYTDSSNESVHMPYPESFGSPAAYAHTVLHELSHWTHWKVRPQDERYFSEMDAAGYTPRYALEELTAEICAGMLAAHYGVAQEERAHVGYLHNWLSALDTAAWARGKSREDTFFDYMFADFNGETPSHHDAHDEAFTLEQWDKANDAAQERFEWLLDKASGE